MRQLRALILMTIGIVGSGACTAREEAGNATPPLALAPCSMAGIGRATECGTLAVPENRERPGQTIPLRVVVVRATQAAGHRAVFFLTGGPGSASTASAGGLTREHARLAASHDFVFVDQRGTGESNPLHCAPPNAAGLPPVFSAEEAELCRDTLQRTADLVSYTTADAVSDLEVVRRALGYERIDLHGSSYGTRLAWAYAAQFPEQARTLVLHGPAPPGFVIPLPFARGLDIALDGLVADCLRDEPCAARFPRLKADVETAFERVSAVPAAVTIDGRAQIPFTRGELSEAVRYLLYSATDARRLPLLLTQAAAANYTPIATASANYRRGLMPTLAMGMYLSVTCAEDIPFLSEGEIASTSQNTKLGDYRVRQQIAACTAWPRGTSRLPKPIPLRVPTLIQVGAYDPATPLEAAQRAAALLTDSRLVVVPHGGHAFAGLGIDECLSGMTGAFITTGRTAAVDGDCVARAKRPPFVLQ